MQSLLAAVYCSHRRLINSLRVTFAELLTCVKSTIISWVVVTPFNELSSGVEINEPILDEFQCLLLDLSNIIYLYQVSLIRTPVSIVIIGKIP